MAEDIESMIAGVVEAEVEDLPEPPQMLVPTVATPQSSAQPLFEDEEMLKLVGETLSNMRNDRKQLDTLISNFVEMVFNEGDSTTASKEALVALMIAKTNMSDKQMKIVDTISKFKLKEMASAPKSVTANQENHYHFGGTRRSFLEQINKRMRKKPEENKNA